MIYCPNLSCQASNPETNRFCQICRTSLPHRYLWAVGEGVKHWQAGSLLADRYLLKGDSIFLDTKPALAPEPLAEVPDWVAPYLRLSGYPVSVPRPYSLLSVQVERQTQPLLLLEESAIAVDPLDRADRPFLLPGLQDSWQSAPALRQLNWLWQIASLWQGFTAEGVATSLLHLSLLRTHGSLLKVQELQADTATHPPTLQDLGQAWQPLVATATPQVKPFLQYLCQSLVDGQVYTLEHLLSALNDAMQQCGQGQSLVLTWTTQTDQGPTRKRNEDACHPPGGSQGRYVVTHKTTADKPYPLVIVCDGIGGHQGGDEASKLAIATVQQHLQGILKQDDLTPDQLTTGLAQSISAANDAIANRNDQEQRQARERMGTTLVIALLYRQDLYIAHVGDSRAYRITRLGCHQITLDDDVAVREVRMGYSFYRDAILHPGAGSLVQALGMATSKHLHPSIQRFVLDDDVVFLLCSDGLSDNDRIEENWMAELLPILTEKRNVGSVGERLIQVANSQNGHDNVTVGVLYIQITQPSTATISPSALTATDSSPSPQPQPTHANSSPTQIVVGTAEPQRSLWPLLGSLLGLSIVAGAIAYAALPGLRQLLTPSTTTSAPISTPTLSSSPQPQPSPALPALAVGTFIQITRVTNSAQANQPLMLQANPPGTVNNSSTPGEATQPKGNLPVGGIFQVLSKQESINRQLWVQIKVCSVPISPSAEPPPSESGAAVPITQTASASPPVLSSVLLQPGDDGWILESTILPVVDAVTDLDPQRRGACTQ